MLTHNGNTLKKQTTLVRVPVSAYNFLFLNVFVLTNTPLNYAVTHPLFNYVFQKLCSQLNHHNKCSQ